MSLSKRRQVDTECRVFQEKRTASYLLNSDFFFNSEWQQVSVLKGYNIRCHYETHHGKKYSLQGQQGRRRVGWSWDKTA